MFKFFAQLFRNMKTVCDATHHMFLTCHFVDALQSYIGIYDINKSTEKSEWVVTSMQIWTKYLLKSIWVWNWNDFPILRRNIYGHET